MSYDQTMETTATDSAMTGLLLPLRNSSSLEDCTSDYAMKPGPRSPSPQWGTTVT